MPKKNFPAFFLLLLCSAGKAQNFPSDSTLARILQSDVLLPLLMDSAAKNSAEIRRMGKNVAMYEQALQSSKKSILNDITLASSYGYGNAGSLALEKDLANTGQSNYYSNLRTSRYNLGVSIQVPLGSLLSRGNQRRSAELQIEMAEQEKEATATVIRQGVIKLYQDLKLAHVILGTRSKMKQVQWASFSLSQKNFTDGQITLEQFSKMQNEYNQTVMDYDSQINKLQTAFLTLEAYSGVQLTRLINRLR